MSQWSEKIPKKNLSKTVSPTRYLVTSFSETWIQINNFRKSSKKFIIDLLTKNIALNLSGAIFFVGLGYSLKWWYKDQLFVVLLRQNLPALSESQQNRETGKSILNDEYQTWTPPIDRIDLDANHICIKFKQPWQKHFYEQFIGVFGEPAQVNISKQILTIPFTREKDWWKENSTNPFANLQFANRLKKSCDSKRNSEGIVLTNLVNKFSTYTLYTYTQKKPIFPKKLFKLSPHNLSSSTEMNPLPHTLTGSFQWRGMGLAPLNQNSLPTTLYPFRVQEKAPYPSNAALVYKSFIYPSGVSKGYIKDLQEIPPDGAKVIPTEFLLNTKERSLFSKAWTLSASARVYPLQSLFGARAVTRVNWGSWRSKASVANPFTPCEAQGYGIKEQKDFSRSFTFPDKLSYPLQLTKKLAGWQPFPNLLVLNSSLDEIPYKLENALQPYFPRKNSQLLFLSTSFRQSINSRNKFLMWAAKPTKMNPSYAPLKWTFQGPEESPLPCKGTGFISVEGFRSKEAREILPQHEKLVMEELEAEGLQSEAPTQYIPLRGKQIEDLHGVSYGVRAHRGLFRCAPKSKNSWVSGASANYKNREIENNEIEKTLDLFKEMFLVPGKQNEQSETYLKKLHLFETKKLLQNQLTSLINSFPIDLVEKSKAIVEKNKQSHALQIIPPALPLSFAYPSTEMNPIPLQGKGYGVRGITLNSFQGSSDASLLGHHLHNNVVNLVNNKSNLSILNGGLLDVSKKILEVKRNILKKAMDPGVKDQYLPGSSTRYSKSLIYNSWQSKKGAINGVNDTNDANDENDANDANLRFARFARFAKFISKESLAKRYWDTEVYRLTQLFAYSTLANTGDAKGLNPLLLLNTLGFTFNNLSPLTNPPIFSSSENKINVIDKNINFDKNSRYMSGYIYPDIESNSLKTFLYPWLGKSKNLMLSPLREYKYHYLNEKPIAPCFAYPIPSSVASELCFAKGIPLRGKQIHFSGALRTPLPHTPCSARVNSHAQGYGVRGNPSSAMLVPYEIYSSLIENKEKNDSLGNSHYMDNIEIPYKKFNHYLAKFPGFSDPTQFFTTLPQIACGNENLVNESAILGEPNFVLQGRGTKKTHLSKINLDLFETEKKIEYVDPVKVSEKISNSNIVDKSEINKKFIQKNGCNSRKVAYSGIVVRRNKKTKDFQPFNFKNPRFVEKCKELNFVYPLPHTLYPVRSSGVREAQGSFQWRGTRSSGLSSVGAASAKSSIWGTLFLGPENPLTNRQCHFFGQKQLSTLDTKSLQRDYLRELGKEILTQSNLKGYTELSKFSSIERTKILSLSKKVNSFFFKKRKYSYLLEPKDQWHLLFQEQLCSALEDCKKYPLSTIHSFEETNMAKLDSGQIKVSAPLIMARFPKKLVQFRSIDDTLPGYVSPQLRSTLSGYRRKPHRDIEMNPIPLQVHSSGGYKLEQGISWRPFCHLQRSFICAPYPSAEVNLHTPVPLSVRSKARGMGSGVLKNNSLIQFSPIALQGFLLYPERFISVERSSGGPPVSARGIPLEFLSRYVSSANAYPSTEMNPYPEGVKGHGVKLVSSKSAFKDRELVQQEYPHYPLFTERFSEEINALPYLNKNSLFYSVTDSSAVTNGTTPVKMNPIPLANRRFAYPEGVRVHFSGLRHPNLKNRKALLGIPQGGNRSSVALPFVTQKNMKNNLVGVQNMCNSLLIQEPLNFNSWAVLNQWVFLIALLFWIEQTLLNHVFPALFALEQILLSAAGLRTGENNRTHVLRISKNERPKFQNLAGIDGLLGELSELVLFLRGQRNLGVAKLSFLNKWNKKNSYGVLLTGSPGTGKTFLVRALANEANVPVLILSASTLTASKLNNNKPSWSIRHAFKRAKQLAPCILFIDEIDALGKSRGKIVTDINEIVADSAASALTSASHKRILTKSTHNHSASLQQMFSYQQFGQNSSNFNATLLNRWEYPLQSTILQESNEINQNSLCQEKLVDLLKVAGGGGRASIRNFEGTSYPLRGMELGTIESIPSGKESAAEFKESINSDIDNKGVLPKLEKEMTRGKFGPLTQLLVSMDGVSSFSGVLIMGATNRPELLDPALTRPGRFEKTIRIDKPSSQNRIEILQLYSQNLGVQQQIPWSYLATRTIGLTTADLAVAMNYSSLRAIIQDSVHTLETIEYGLNCITRL